jgi:hypothetical protein
VALPNEVVIGPYRYRIAFVPKLLSDNEVRLAGQIEYSTCTISISPEAVEQKQIVTLFHEILHGIANVHGFETFNGNEADVDRLAHGLVALLQDNPKLVGLFTKKQSGGT